MRPVFVAGVAQLDHVTRDAGLDEAEMVQAVASEALREAGLDRQAVGFTCSGSSDYVMGRPFSFTMALDGVGPWPPIRESHVEMDGAWALYEAWVRLQHGDVDTALVYSYGKSTPGGVEGMLTAQLDPYTLAPLAPSPMALAGLQARALLLSGRATERDLASAVVAARRASRANPRVPDLADVTVDELLAAPCVASPLRAHDGPVRTDGAAAVVLRVGGPGVRIAGLAHRIEPQDFGLRDLADSVSTREAAQAAGGVDVDVAELCASYAHQVPLLVAALGLGPDVSVNPSGGALAADTPMVAGLVRIVEAVRAVRGGASRALAHATTGPCLQHNLVAILEAA